MTDSDAALVPEDNEALLNEKQLVDYEDHRRRFVEWLSEFGKDPSALQGYAEDTVYRTAYRCAKFDRWTWQEEGQYTMLHSHDDADAYLRHLATNDNSSTHLANTRDALRRYFKWRNCEFGEDEWEPELTISKDTNVQPRDFLSKDERKRLRKAALNYGNIPAYDSLSPEERTRWKRYVSQRLRKPLDDVVPDDWEKVNGWKFTTIVWTSLDAGLRPAEVARAKVSWVDIDNEMLRIPVEDSTKNADNWPVSLSERTTDALERWIEEREMYDRYEGTDALWLTRESNPYGPNSLRRLLHRLCGQAGIETENRKMSWYTIRHSVGTYMTRAEDLAAAKAQLRHRSVQTTTKYDAAPVEDRRDALNKMG